MISLMKIILPLFSVDAVEVLDWDSEGKVKGGKIFYDRLTALEQIGLVPSANNTILPYLHWLRRT
jgi:hypothetical protein